MPVTIVLDSSSQNVYSRVRLWKTNYTVIKSDINTSLLREACCPKIVADDSHSNNLLTFSGAFAKLRKGTISIIMSGRLSAYLFVRMDQLGFHLREFYEILYWRIFRKSAEKIQVSLKFDNNNGYFTCRRWYIMIRRRILLKVETFQTEAVEQIKTHILYSMTFSGSFFVY